jgi:putative Mg2+ transporter-C (MgtC) family protein
MAPILGQIAAELGAAWAAGALIGAERSFHGRAAGFRTHALVAIAASAAMVVSPAPQVAQGVVTGIGFLGAGVIFKEGVNVQGLTSAASVWGTAVLGLLFGVGEFAAGTMATGAVLTTLLVMRWIENLLPMQIYAWSVVRFRTGEAPDTAGLKAMLAAYGVSFRDVSYAVSHESGLVEFSGNLMARGDHALDELAAHLRGLEGVAEFEMSRISK